MFVQINNKRIKITSISRYNDEGYSQSTQKFRIALKISNVWEIFYFDKEVEKDNVLKNLDNTLKVTAL
jgi:hypothetical protein